VLANQLVVQVAHRIAPKLRITTRLPLFSIWPPIFLPFSPMPKLSRATFIGTLWGLEIR